MTTIHQKQEIVQSLNNLDAVQSEKVLEFIKTLQSRQSEDEERRLKRTLLKEINVALGHARLWI